MCSQQDCKPRYHRGLPRHSCHRRAEKCYWWSRRRNSCNTVQEALCPPRGKRESKCLKERRNKKDRSNSWFRRHFCRRTERPAERCCCTPYQAESSKGPETFRRST